jgi:hypothetical protein
VVNFLHFLIFQFFDFLSFFGFANFLTLRVVGDFWLFCFPRGGPRPLPLPAFLGRGQKNPQTWSAARLLFEKPRGLKPFGENIFSPNDSGSFAGAKSRS